MVRFTRKNEDFLTALGGRFMKAAIPIRLAILSILTATALCVTPSYGMLYNQDTQQYYMDVSVFYPGQSFTATDSDIGYVGVLAVNGGTFTISLYEGAGFSGTLMSSQLVSPGDNTWANLNTSSLTFSQGSVYTIRMTGSGGSVGYAGGSAGPYSGGDAYIYGMPYEQYDLTFHVGPRASTVPIPAAVWLLGSGLIGLIGVRRFRK